MTVTLGPVHMTPVWWEAHLSRMNYFCVHMTVFIPPNIPPQRYKIMYSRLIWRLRSSLCCH